MKFDTNLKSFGKVLIALNNNEWKITKCFE